MRASFRTSLSAFVLLWACGDDADPSTRTDTAVFDMRDARIPTDDGSLGEDASAPRDASATDERTVPDMADADTSGLECPRLESDPNVLFCDDFESPETLNAREGGRYWDNALAEIDPSMAFRGTGSARFSYQAGRAENGKLWVSLGEIPNVFGNRFAVENAHARGERLREVYWRFYIRMEDGWEGNPYKLTRATIFHEPGSGGQVMIAHIWEDSELGVKLDPVSLVRNGTASASRYNDWTQMCWLNAGSLPDGCPSSTGAHFPARSPQIFATDQAGQWRCVEAHLLLNDGDTTNGVFEYWLDGERIDRHDSLNLIGAYQVDEGYGINTVMLENFHNGGAVRDQDRHFDNFVISRSRIGCLE